MPKWTDDQVKVIERREKNILVSAAAGSGKTAVLVERIMQRITDPIHPVDVDRLLVVTFTKAAAKEMQERIRDNLTDRMGSAASSQEKQRLERQRMLLSHAKITTIDSFCGYVVKNHFEEIGLDPGYRIYDQGELTILMQEVMEDYLETQYQEGKPEFLELVRTYGKKDKDDAIIEMILSLIQVADCYPRPYAWFDSARHNCLVNSEQEFYAEFWLKEFLTHMKCLLESALRTNHELTLRSGEPDGAPGDHVIYENEEEQLQKVLSKAENPKEFLQAWSEITFGKMAGGKAAKGIDAELRGELRARRKSYMDEIKQFTKMLGEGIPATLQDLELVRPYLLELIRLAEGYHKTLDERKAKENAFDFSDIERFAFDILIDGEGKRTTVAEEMTAEFDEIMVDEYQDSNKLQEQILLTVAGGDAKNEPLNKPGENKYFMVGDVKQSIYRFRQADPSIFMRKLEVFEVEAKGNDELILLSKNFRSREEVVQCVNSVFRRIMHQEVGGVEYDETHFLNKGATYPAPEGNEFLPELLLGVNDSGESENSLDDTEFEARMIAGRIRHLLDQSHVTENAEQGTYRRTEPRDIAILLRSVKGDAEKMAEILGEYGIPTHVMNQSGYYTAVEIETVLSFLEILENPLQDIPLAAVLHSPMFGVTSEELSEVRIQYEDKAFSEGVFLYGKEHLEDGEKDSITRFYETYETLRQEMADLPLHRVITRILEVTDYQLYMRSLPGGDVRNANLDKLVDQAISFEHSGGVGVFSFVDYIRRLKKYQVDAGNAELLGEEDNCVRIMTIHKSKGLEFPIVFVSDVTKGFMLKETQGRLLVSPTYGVALQRVSGRYRIARKNFYDYAISYLMQQEEIGEQLRVLYVAMTRAKEKLIFTGVTEEKAVNEMIARHDSGEKLPYEEIASAKSYFHWLSRSLFVDSGIQKAIYYTADLMEEEEYDKESEDFGRENILELLKEASSSEGQDILSNNLSFQYETRDSRFKNKYSVSELKHAAMQVNFKVEEQEEEDAVPEFLKEERKKTIPAFLRQEKKQKANQGALRGTAMHRAMELLDLQDSTIYEEMGLLAAIDEMERSGRLHQDEKELLHPDKILKFLSSKLSQRMKEADANGNLFREAPFVMGETPENLFENVEPSDKEELILIQGIIDAYFVEGDQVTLVDYKTDRIKKGDELILRYKKQMELYRDAIEKATGKKVQEAVLYSFSLNEEVIIPFSVVEE